MIRRMIVAAFVGCALVLTSVAAAQDAGGGGGGGRGGFDPAQMRERMMKGYKDQMGASDEEFKVIQPKLEKVMTAQRDARVGGFGFGRGGRGGRDGGAATDQPQSALAKATAELRTALENKETKAEELVAKLKTLREARDKARADLATAQKELKEVLTQRQEAAMVIAGLLE